MYYWNTKALAHELAEDTLSKQHYKNYYLAAALVVSAVYYYGMYSPYSDIRVIGIEAALTLLIMLIWNCFWASFIGNLSIFWFSANRI